MRGALFFLRLPGLACRELDLAPLELGIWSERRIRHRCHTEPRVHVVFLTQEYPPLPSGGVGTSIRALAVGLVAAGHRATVLGYGDVAEFEDRGVVVRFLGRPRLPGVGALFRCVAFQRELRRLGRNGGIDVVEAPDGSGPSAGLRLRVPVVVRCNGSSTYFGHLLGTRVRPSVAWLERKALREASSVAAVSRFTATLTRKLFKLHQPVHVIPNGVNVTQFEPGWNVHSQPTVLYLGTVVRKKGVLDLCRAFSMLADRRPAARLVLVGRDVPDHQTGGPSTWALCRSLLSPAAVERTSYLGECPHDQVQAVLRTASVCVFPSYAEALSVAWLEAMCCAKPIVAYDIGWASEIVEPGKTGELVPPGDFAACARAIEALLDDPPRAAALGRAGRERVEAHFSIDQVVSRSITWYRQVLAEQ
jgi:glycosyltransferase involved in cell wall biosynthesis